MKQALLLLYLPYYLAAEVITAVGSLLMTALARSYFRVTACATVYSRHVSRAAQLGRNVLVCRGALVAGGVVVGDYTYVNVDSIVESGVIGKFCSIGARASIGPPEHPTHHLSTHPATYSEPVWGIIDAPKPLAMKPPPVIGNDVWVGRSAFILRGVIVGDGAVIAAGAIVTKDVPPYAVAAGVPARILGERFDPETAAAVARLSWWDDVPRLRQLLAEGAIGVERYVGRASAGSESGSAADDTPCG